MKRRILLFMMTALLSVGAWAKYINHFWTGSQKMESYVSPLKLETSSLSLSVGDILSFTISNVTDTGYGLRVCAHNAENAGWYGDVVKSVPATEDGVITIVVDEAIKTAAETELWINGNFTLTAVDIETQNIWTGSQKMESYVSPLKLKTSSLSLTAGDLLTFTISNVTDTGYGLRVCAHNAENAGWYGDVVKSVPATEDGVVKMVIDNDIITAAATELWINGNFTLTSIDVEKAACVNLYNETTIMNYWSTNLSSSILKYAKTGDILNVTISAVGDNENWRKLFLQDAAGNANDGSYTGNILYTCENGNLKVGTIDIRLTDAMVSKAQAGSLYIGGFDFTFTAVDLYHAPIELANAGDNTTTISDWKSISTNVTLADRTLTKDGNWNTLCLPFAVSAGQLAETTNPLYGATIKELNASSSSLDSDGILTLAFTDASSIEAGKPYIVKWTETSGSVVNPLFEGVTITATTPTAVEFTNNAGGGNCKFVGQFSPFTIDADNKDEIIMLGSGSKLGYSKNARELKTFRAHFEVPGRAAARAFVMNFGDEETTGIISVQGSGSMVNGSDAWYSLGGQRLQGAPTAKGVYIQNGRKVVVK